MTTIKYVGSADNYAELPVTGNQSIWQIGQQEERPYAEAALLMATGLFDSQQIPVTSAVDPVTGMVEISASGLKVRAAYVDPSKTDSFKAVVTEAGTGYVFVRYAWDATYDAVAKVRIYSTDQSANGPVDFYGIKSIPIATANSASAVIAAYLVGTSIASEGDSAGTFNYNATYIGANHGPFIAHAITCAGHGKTNADVGSEWSALGRKFYIAKIVDANTLWLVSENSGTHDRWVFYTTLMPTQAFVHSGGAANTSTFTSTADAIAQLSPSLNKRSLHVCVDDALVGTSSSALYTPGKFQIFERYSIINPADAVAFIKENVGKYPSFSDESIANDVAVSNIHNWNSNGCHTVEQTVTWISAVNQLAQYVVQCYPPVFSGNTLSQYVPGVSLIGGLDYKSKVDITAGVTPFSVASANWSDQENSPNRLAQIVSNAGVNKYGSVVGFSPIRGVTTRKKRLLYSASNAATVPSNGTKKQYPYAVIKDPAIGDSYTAIGYYHVFNSAWTPDATVATWFRDGDDYVVILDFHKVSALSRVALPAYCDGFTARLVDSLNVTLLTNAVIDSGGIAVACTSTYGYAVIRVSAI